MPLKTYFVEKLKKMYLLFCIVYHLLFGSLRLTIGNILMSAVKSIPELILIFCGYSNYFLKFPFRHEIYLELTNVEPSTIPISILVECFCRGGIKGLQIKQL